MGKRSGEELGLETPGTKKMRLSAPKEHDEVFADPTYDFTFKMLFGNEANKDILISVLNGLLNFRGNEQIEDVSIISNELPSDYELPKFVREFKSENITSKDPIKHQWLDFLVKCADQTELPHDVDEIIKKGIKLWK